MDNPIDQSPIADQIKSKSESLAKKILDKAHRVSERELSLAREEAQKILQQVKVESEKEHSEEYKTSIMRAKMEARLLKLSWWDTLGDKILNEVIESFAKMPRNDEYFQILAKLIFSALKMLNVKKAVIYCNEQDRKFLSDEIRWEQLQNYLNNTSSVNFEPELADEAIGTSGGVIVSSCDGKILYDNTFDDLTNRHKEKLKLKLQEEMARNG